MDPVTLVMLLVLAGGVSAFVALRRSAAEADGSRVFRSTDPRSVVVGLVVIAAALALTYLLVVGR